jgi:hypothetical protein
VGTPVAKRPAMATHLRAARGILALALVVALVACGGQNEAVLPVGDVHVEQLVPVPGIADDGRDPAVVAIRAAGESLCTAVVVAPDIVLTARHCVARTVADVECPATGPQVTGERDPTTLDVLSGDDPASAILVAHGRALVAPPGNKLCGTDIALLLLDRPVEHVAPLEVAELGVTQGARVRTVGFGPSLPSGPVTKLLREHVAVLDTTLTEFRLGEYGCPGDSGGPALDEATGAVVGVVSRPGPGPAEQAQDPGCPGASGADVYTRADIFLGLVRTAFAQSLGGEGAAAEQKDGGIRAVKLATDYGSPCANASQCAAGVCVNEQKRQYCSRSCEGQDKCPTHYKCEPSIEGPFVCVEP